MTNTSWTIRKRSPIYNLSTASRQNIRLRWRIRFTHAFKCTMHRRQNAARFSRMTAWNNAASWGLFRQKIVTAIQRTTRVRVVAKMVGTVIRVSARNSLPTPRRNTSADFPSTIMQPLPGRQTATMIKRPMRAIVFTTRRIPVGIIFNWRWMAASATVTPSNAMKANTQSSAFRRRLAQARAHTIRCSSAIPVRRIVALWIRPFTIWKCHRPSANSISVWKESAVGMNHRKPKKWPAPFCRKMGISTMWA